MPDVLELEPLEPTSGPRSFDLASIDRLAESEIDQLPFGIIALDGLGFVLRYNLYESRLARLDRNDVLGRSFFDEIARCTKTEAFFGRFQALLAGGKVGATERFEYVFGFAFGEQKVAIEMMLANPDRVYLIINRTEVTSKRTLGSDVPLAVLQKALAPNETLQGVRRDELERRFVDVPAAFFLALRATCERVAPESWQLFAMEWGLQWGRRTAIDLEAWAMEHGHSGLGQLSMTELTKLVSSTLGDHGWGRATFDFGLSTEGILSIEVERSPMADAFGQQSRRDPSRELACHLLAGLHAGLLSHVAERRLAVREVACRAAGASHCAFVVVAHERRKVVDTALREGVRGVDRVRESLRRAPRGPSSESSS
jgi:photoactive yellow protein